LPPNPTDALRRAQDAFSPLQGDVLPNDLLPSNPSDALRRALPSPSRRDADLPSVDPSDALRRAQELSSPAPRDFVPTGLSTPSTVDGADLGDQIRRLGTTIPNAQPPELHLPEAAGSAALSPPAPRVITPLPSNGNRRPGSGVPPANERRLAPDEVVIEVANNVTAQAIAALQQRHRLAQLDQFTSQLSGTTMLRSRILDRRTVAAVVRELEGDAVVMSAQPNYRFALQAQGDGRPAADDSLQYAAAKLRLPQAHELAKGRNVFIAMIDSGVDTSHPELDGAIAGTFDTIDGSGKPHSHGTAIAGLIAAHARLMGSAPAARILAVRAFDATGTGSEGSTFNILKGLDWAAVNGARVINMSFAGPSDPAIRRDMEAAYKNAIVLIAAAGNAGPKSPPLYPAADPYVIAVTATDSEDKIFAGSNRGAYIAMAAPGVDILAAAPDGAYQIQSGTSFSAAELSGIAALMIERRPNLTPSAIRSILSSTAKPLTPETKSKSFSPRLADAYQAISVDAPPPVAVTATQGR
jgi:subtilisin family serine protease